MQVLVYAGAIMVLFLFVIMMLQGPVLEGERAKLKAWRPLVALLPAAAVLVTVVTWVRREDMPGFSGPAVEGYGSVVAVSQLLLGDYLLAFELISVVLLVGIIGALSLGKAERRLPWK
jgi:NADH-quinone oxidoreductase subunit J